MIEVIRLSQKAKDQLVWLKRQTGITQWNILCRWALCVSLADTMLDITYDDASDSNLEMRWDVFAGEYKDVYTATILLLCKKENIEVTAKCLTKYIRQHIHRGVARLVDEKLRGQDGLIAMVSNKKDDANFRQRVTAQRESS